MKKRLLSCLFAIAMMVGFLPIAVSQTSAAATQNGGVAVQYANVSTGSGAIPYINVSFTTRGDEPTAVEVAVVPAGTKHEDVPSVARLKMEPSGIINTGGTLTTQWEYRFDSKTVLSDMGDFNLWFFVDGNTKPITDNKYWRVSDLSASYYNSSYGIDPNREYAKITESTSTGFTLTAYSVLGNTYFELIHRETKAVADKIDIAKAGAVPYTFAAGLTGTYILRYTRGDGKTQNIAYFRLLGGSLPLDISYYDTGKAALNPSGSNGSIEGWSNGETSAGAINVHVYVTSEDFDYPVELFLVNKDNNAETPIAAAFSTGNGALGAGVGMEVYNPRYGWVEYIFNFYINKPSDDGIYLLRVKRGNEVVDIWQFEIFKGRLYGMLPGETPIEPLSADYDALKDDYNRIFILGESFEVGSAAVSYFSLDGGKKWQPVSNMANYKKRDPRTNQLASSKVFDKGFELWFSDTAPAGNQMPDDAKLIKFPVVGKRPAAPKLEVDYQLAHMNGNGVLNFNFYDENLWVAVEKGKTVPLSEGYLYYYGGQKEDNQGYFKQTGKPDWEDRPYALRSGGMPIPESDEDNGGIKYSETSDKVSYRSIKENYFISAVPCIKDGAYYPASKPAKLAVSSYAKPKAMKIDYKKETLKLTEGAVFEDKRIYSEIVSSETAKSKTEGVISVTKMLDEEWLCGDYQIVPTAKKPASCPVFWEFAYRGTDIMELESDGYRDKEVNFTEYGKLTPSKALEFRQKIDGVWGNWGSYKAPKEGGEEYEYRTKATAKSGKLMFEDEWYMWDGIIFKREDEEEVWASGEAQNFVYGWGTNYETKSGKTPSKDGVEWTNIG